MNMIISITSSDDPRIAHYRQIRERDLVGREELFIAEGEVVLRLLVQSTIMKTCSVLLLEKRVATLKETLAYLQKDVPVYVASQEVMDAIAGFHIHRGVLAIGKRSATPSANDLLSTLPPRALVLGLVGISNHDNMGGLFRNAAAFGANAVLADTSCCDPLYRKAIRVSVGSVLKVPFAMLQPGDDIIDIMQRHEIIPVALTPSGTTLLSTLHRPPRVGLLMGAEGPGLPNELMAKCRTVSIPMAPGFDSLNVATASGIVLHHLAFGTCEDNH